jgi:hypothetical protein
MRHDIFTLSKNRAIIHMYLLKFEKYAILCSIGTVRLTVRTTVPTVVQ